MSRGGFSRGASKSRIVAGMAIAATLLMVTAACGGGGNGKKAASGADAGTTTTTEPTTASTVAGTTETSAAAAPVTALAPNATTTTAKKTTSAAKATATTRTANTIGNSKPVSGIKNVTAPPQTAVPDDLQIGGTLTLLKSSDPIGYDPIVLTAAVGADGPTSFAVYGELVYADPADGLVKPYMAESLTSSDALVWTMKLRPNIKFTDGTPYDAAAVKFNYQRLQDPKNNASRAAQANTIATMDVVDPLTLRMTLKAKNAVFPQSIALIPYVGSPKAIQEKGANFTNDPVGAGPFTLKSWVRDSTTTFVRNPTYWDAPRPYLDTVVMRTVADESQRLNTALSGQGQIVWTVTTGTADQARKAGLVENAAVQNGGPNIYFNVRQGKPFADYRARLAFTEAIDRCDLVKQVLNNVVECEDSIFRHNSPYYDPTITQTPYNPTDAQNLFNQLAQENGGTYKINLTTFQTGNWQAEAQYIQAKLNSYKNVKVDLTLEATNLHINKTLAGDFEVTGYSNPFDDPEPTWTGVFVCANPASPTGWCNKDYDAAVDRGRLTLDQNERIQAMKDAQKAFYKDLPGFYFERRVTWNFSVAAVQNIHMVNDGTILLDRVWLKR